MQSSGGASVALETVDAWWRAANYLSVGQIYLMRNPLLDRPLEADDIKPRLLGHWGTSPGLNLVYAHLNRAIVERGTPTLYVCGPGHGGPAMVANTWLDGTYSELFPAITDDRRGHGAALPPVLVPRAASRRTRRPRRPGSINEGGELGYSLMHAFGAALDNPGLVVACVVGDGEAETGPLAASWRGHSFLNPVTDGAVLPILHLNGYKIANPTLLARIPEAELVDFFRGNGYEPLLVTGGFDGEDPMAVHARLADAIDVAYERIASIRADAAAGAFDESAPRWPAIVLRTPKGWTGPARGRRRAGGGHLPRAPGSARRRAREPRAPRDARGVAAVVPARGALRPRRTAGRRPRRAAAAGRPADERDPDRERRHRTGARPAAARRRSPSTSTRGPAARPARRMTIFGDWLAELMRRNPTTCGSSDPTRCCRTGSAPCST